jgi:hypothetical protein
MYPTYVPPKEVNAFAGLMGTSPNTFEVARTPVQEGVHADFIDGSGTLALQQLGPRRLHLSVTSTEEARVQLSQMWFPLWTMNTGRIASSSTSNLLQVKSPPGRHEYEFTLGDGLPERVGLRVTVLSIFIAACGTLFSLRRSLRTAINPETAVLHSRRALDAVQSPL